MNQTLPHKGKNNSSETSKTLDAWTGSQFYRKLFQIELFGFRLVLWKAPKYIDLTKKYKDYLKE